MTRIGVVDYVNALPLIHGLERERGVEIVRDTPAGLVKRLKAREIHVGLISAIECFRHPSLRMLPEIGVCSEGPIKSVKLFVRGRLENVRTVALDRGSRSAATLTRILFAEFLEIPDVEFHDIEPSADLSTLEADAVLLIGDTALRATADDRNPIDLGAFWTERTGLPFVYAVWGCRKGSKAERLLPLLLRARDRGLPQRPRLAQQAAEDLGLPVAGLLQYLTRNLRYQLGERELKGLERFRDIAAEHGLCSRHDVPFVGARVQSI